MVRQLSVQSTYKFLEMLWVKLTEYKVFLCNISLKTWGWQLSIVPLIIKLELQIETT